MEHHEDRAYAETCTSDGGLLLEARFSDPDPEVASREVVLVFVFELLPEPIVKGLPASGFAS